MTPNETTALRALAEKWNKEADARDATGELGQISDALVLDNCARELLAKLDELRREELRTLLKEEKECDCDSCRAYRCRLEAELRELENKR